jgi:hypothetical protein
MSQDNFAEELRGLGFEMSETDAACGRIARFSYEVPTGTHVGELVRLGFLVPPDYNLTCPSGPYVSPLVLPINTDTSEPPFGGVHVADQAQPAAGFGPDWEYWSRPFPGWPASTRDARAYMAHIAHLFDLI